MSHHRRPTQRVDPEVHNKRKSVTVARDCRGVGKLRAINTRQIFASSRSGPAARDALEAARERGQERRGDETGRKKIDEKADANSRRLALQTRTFSSRRRTRELETVARATTPQAGPRTQNAKGFRILTRRNMRARLAINADDVCSDLAEETKKVRARALQWD